VGFKVAKGRLRFILVIAAVGIQEREIDYEIGTRIHGSGLSSS
jgi:hypothetical protein